MKMLNLPKFTFRYKEESGKKFIYDEVRSKFVVLTPEEWVRQNFLRYMHEHLQYPRGLTGVEKMLKIGGMAQRCDIVLYNRKGRPVMIVECKAPSVVIGDSALQQAARYNTTLKVPYLVLTNGIHHYCIFTDISSGDYSTLPVFPKFGELQENTLPGKRE
ncbi:MAG: type I restriction enzyme HsdR N-terminal domain-containing protein [Marinilabilia sp.]